MELLPSAAFDAGLSHVTGLQFRVSNQRHHQFEARKLAIAHAKEKAEHLAKLIGTPRGLRNSAPYPSHAKSPRRQELREPYCLAQTLCAFASLREPSLESRNPMRRGCVGCWGCRFALKRMSKTIGTPAASVARLELCASRTSRAALCRLNLNEISTSKHPLRRQLLSLPFNKPRKMTTMQRCSPRPVRS
ncbi:MAG: SIMPL domain-containing protein [Planctomycetales bacterium]|nr:SIMPL domain-containing protein [Planctomycetales bacterium]